MTRVLNGSSASDLSEQVITYCRCFEIARVDGQVIRLTDHSKNLTFLGETFISDGGFTISALESGENLAVDNADVDIIFKSTAVNINDIYSGVYDGASVRVFMVNFTNTANYFSLPGGFLLELKSSDTAAGTFQLASLSTKLNQNLGRIVTPLCDADVGDSRCGVNLTSFTATGTITSVIGRQIFSDSSRAEADDYFNYGKLTWTSGLNSGISSEVFNFESSTFTLQGPSPQTVQVGDTYTVHRGCDRTKNTCLNVFNNVVNFRGFPFNIDQIELLGGPK